MTKQDLKQQAAEVQVSRIDTLYAMAEKATQWVAPKLDIFHGHEEAWCEWNEVGALQIPVPLGIQEKDDFEYLVAANPPTLKQLLDLARTQHRAILWARPYVSRIRDIENLNGVVAAYEAFDKGE